MHIYHNFPKLNNSKKRLKNIIQIIETLIRKTPEWQNKQRYVV